MAGNRRRDSADAEAAARGLLARWSERKRAAKHAVAEPQRSCTQSVPSEADAAPAKVLTDQDMPALETLHEQSDYSGFLSPGVSDGLRRLALRQLFRAAKFQACDGLDDYDRDYNCLLPLPRALATAVAKELTQHLGRSIDGTAAVATTPCAAQHTQVPESAAPAEADAAPEATGRSVPENDG